MIRSDRGSAAANFLAWVAVLSMLPALIWLGCWDSIRKERARCETYAELGMDAEFVRPSWNQWDCMVRLDSGRWVKDETAIAVTSTLVDADVDVEGS